MTVKNTRSKLLKLVKQSFPHIGWKTARYISSGNDNDVVVLDEKILIRFPKNNYSKKILKDEIGLLNLLKRRLATSVPQYMHVSQDFSCGAYPLIKGVGLTQEKYRKLSSSERKKLAGQLADFLTELHAIPPSSVEKFNIPERFPTNELGKLYKDAKKYLYPLFSPPEKVELEAFFSELPSVFKQKYRKTLVHGDFSGDHFIINSKNNLEGIIDFTDKAIHDPAFDFIFLWHFGPEFVKAVYEKYTGKSKKGLIERSILYAQASALWNMINAKKSEKTGYSEWYNRFKNLRATNQASKKN